MGRRKRNTSREAFNSNIHKATKRRRKRKYKFNFIVFIFILLISTMVSIIIFFNIENIKVVQSSAHYSDSQVKEATGILYGTNIFRINKQEVVDKLKSELPYIDEVTIKRNFPNEISIAVKDVTAFSYVLVKDKKMILSDKGKALELTDKRTEFTVLKGSGIMSPTIGKIADFKDEASLNIYMQLCEAFKRNNISEYVTEIDISKKYDICFDLDARTIVHLGNLNNIDWKINTVNAIIKNRDEDEVKGPTQKSEMRFGDDDSKRIHVLDLTDEEWIKKKTE